MLRIEPFFNVSTSMTYSPEQQLAIDTYLSCNETLPSRHIMCRAGCVFAVFNDTAFKMASWILEENIDGVEIIPIFMANKSTRGKFDAPHSFGPLHLIKSFKTGGYFISGDWRVIPIHFGFAKVLNLRAADDCEVDGLLNFDISPLKAACHQDKT